MPDLPDGFTTTRFRSHPVYQLIRDAAYHGRPGLPTEAELDALKLSPTDRAQLRDDCREVAAIHDEGFHAVAWMRGDECAAALIDGLPDELRDPGYYKPPEDLSGLGPAELADRVRRA